MPKRDNRLWLPQYRGVQATFCLCEKCDEAYEASLKHVCRKRNSYPMQPKQEGEDGQTEPLQVGTDAR